MIWLPATQRKTLDYKGLKILEGFAPIEEPSIDSAEVDVTDEVRLAKRHAVVA